LAVCRPTSTACSLKGKDSARRFDRSLSWVSRRLALVDLLPEAIPQQVREGRVSAHLAMKFLVPVARVGLEDCERMAAAFARHHCDTRQAGQWYAAWRDGSPLVRQRLLDQPELFFKAQRQAEPKAPAAGAGLLRDLEMAAAIVNRAQRRLAGAGAAEMDRHQRQAARLLDVEGYVALHTNRYSVPVDGIGRRVEVRETKDKIEIQLDARHLVPHTRLADAEHQRVMLPQLRPPRGQAIPRPDPHPEEKAILAALPEMAEYVAALKQRGRKAVTLALRQLLRLVREYPRPPLLAAVREAARYGLYDLDRLERMILRRVAREYFLLEDGQQSDD
jgi:hypothetical protein